MKQLPKLPRSETRQTRAQVSFGGYDHRPSCSEGGIYEMQNLTCGDAPLLATRPGRTKVCSTGTQSNGLFASSAGLICLMMSPMIQGNATDMAFYDSFFS